MNNIDVDRRLALAIGYTADRVRVLKGTVYWSACVEVQNDHSRDGGPHQSAKGWQRFDHTDPDVIWPIAERFDAFPMDRHCSDDYFATVGYASNQHVIDKNPATATALAVIHHVESKP